MRSMYARNILFKFESKITASHLHCTGSLYTNQDPGSLWWIWQLNYRQKASMACSNIGLARHDLIGFRRGKLVHVVHCSPSRIFQLDLNSEEPTVWAILSDVSVDRNIRSIALSMHDCLQLIKCHSKTFGDYKSICISRFRFILLCDHTVQKDTTKWWCRNEWGSLRKPQL